MPEKRTERFAAIYTVSLDSGLLLRTVLDIIGQEKDEIWRITGPDVADLVASNYRRLADSFIEMIKKCDMDVHVISGDIAGISNEENRLFIRELLAETARLCPTIPAVLYSGIYRIDDLSLTKELPNIHVIDATNFDMREEHTKVRELARKLR